MVTEEPRVEVDRYVVYPTGYDTLTHSDKALWCLNVTNGHAGWGWRITRGRGMDSQISMNRRGKWIVESRGSLANKPRRYPLAEALEIAKRFVDAHTINGRTAVEASNEVRARLLSLGVTKEEAGIE